jgi:transketolase
MRKEFSHWLERTMTEDPRTIFLTGDLGYNAFENVLSVAQDRFVNIGVSEQNMIGLAAGLASQGLRPICYSIAPFAVFRPLEQIRLDVCIHNLDVKIVGNGGGYGYGIMGPTHHALEDIACLSPLPNMKCFVPLCNEDLPGSAQAMMNYRGPSYLRLGAGAWPGDIPLPAFSPLRPISSSASTAITALSLGPVTLNLVKAAQKLESELGKPKLSVSVYAAGLMPLPELSAEFLADVSRTGQLLVIEEHVRRGGLAEQVSLMLMERGITARVKSLSAIGYPGGTYGSQAYHQRVSSLDAESIEKEILRAV